MEKNELVYIATNKGMPDLVKIGFTQVGRLEIRLKELFTTGVPYPYEAYYFSNVRFGKKVEKVIHNYFADVRVETKDREFFYTSPEEAKKALVLASLLEDQFYKNEITVKQKINKINKSKINDFKRARLSNYTFTELNIPIGAELSFLKDEKIVCTVHSDNLVNYDGEIITLTEAARKTGQINFKEIQGPRYWNFNNENLVNRRKRIRANYLS